MRAAARGLRRMSVLGFACHAAKFVLWQALLQRVTLWAHAGIALSRAYPSARAAAVGFNSLVNVVGLFTEQIDGTLQRATT